MKKTLKVTVCLLLAVLMLAAALCGCGKSPADAKTKTEKTAYEYGLDVVALMNEMVKSEDYLTTFSASGDIASVAEEISKGDYSEPTEAYKISVPDVKAALSSLGESESASLGDLPESLMEYLNHSVARMLVTQLNGRLGANFLAASSIFTANKIFVCSELEKDCIYLYVYDGDYAVAVAFTVGENDAASATGSFIMSENLSETLESFEQSGCTAEKLTVD